jgi:hypothetical protein
MDSAERFVFNGDKWLLTFDSYVKERGILKKDIAQKMNLSYPNLLKRLKFGDYRLSFLSDIGQILDVDLYTLISWGMKYSINDANNNNDAGIINDELKERIIELEKENERQKRTISGLLKALDV